MGLRGVGSLFFQVVCACSLEPLSTASPRHQYYFLTPYVPSFFYPLPLFFGYRVGVLRFELLTLKFAILLTPPHPPPRFFK